MGSSSDSWIAPAASSQGPVFLQLLEKANRPAPNVQLFGGRYQLVKPEQSPPPVERWLAQQNRAGGLSKLVRIKLLRAESQDHEVWRAALLDEVMALTSIDHPNIVQLLDVVECDQGMALVREYVDGVALSEVLSVCQGAGVGMPMDLAVYLASEISWVLDAVHGAADSRGRPLGLVHRGVHPSQIQVTRSGHVKLDGFDLARMNAGRRAATEPGLVKGFAAYLPPECIAGEPATSATDVYALGVMLFELLTGEPCFQGETAAEVLGKVVHDGPPLQRLQKHRVPPELRAIVDCATQLSPEDRYCTAGEMARALDAYAEVIRRHGRPWQLRGYFEAQGMYPAPLSERLSEVKTGLVCREIAEPEAVPFAARISSGLAYPERTEVTERRFVAPLPQVVEVIEPLMLDDEDVLLVTPLPSLGPSS